MDIKNCRKKIILFVSREVQPFDEKLLSFFEIEKIYISPDYVNIWNIITNNESEKINHADYIFLFHFTSDTDNPYKLLKYLFKNKIENYKYLSEEDYVYLLKKYLMEYFIYKNIDISDDIIKINKYIFNNFFISRNHNIKITDLGDTVLPSIFSDYSMVREGAFEYDKVTLNKNDIVLDCGAHIGAFTAIALSKECEVHAFEPVPETFEHLKKNLYCYLSNKLYLNNTGLADAEYAAEFSIYPDSDANSMILKNDECEKVYYPVITVDQYVKNNSIKRVNFIKADIEGSERYMLLGAKDTISNFLPKLSICAYHLEDDFEVIGNIIRSFNANYIIKRKWSKIYAYVN